MSESVEFVHLITENELAALAVVGGMERVLSFRPEQQLTQAQWIQTAYQLLQTGRLVWENGKVRLQPELAPLFEVMKGAEKALMLTPRSQQVPQLCLYCGGSTCVYLIPHESRDGWVRLGSVEKERLPELLVELGLFPLQPDGELPPLRDADIPALDIPEGKGWQNAGREALDEAVLTVLEKISLRDGSRGDRAMIFRTPLIWATAFMDDTTEYAPYSRTALIKWLEEDTP